jgi:uncharacterized protein YbjT (DUF2867 family)
MILVTGATGHNGMELIQQLSKSGAIVRAMTRKPHGRASDAFPAVEFVMGDFDDAATIRRALDGVERAFLVTNSSDRAEEQQLRFVRVARSSGLRHMVYLSQLHAARNSPVRFLRYHAVVEEAIALSGMDYTHLRPNLFMQGLLAFRSTIAAEGRFFAPVGDARVSVVDVRDIAAVAAAALTEDGHEGRTYDITGPQALTHADMAGYLSRELRKDVAFVDVPEPVMRSALLGFGFPEWQADGLIEDYAHYRRGEASAIYRGVEDVTGQPPRSFADFVHDYRFNW